MPLCGKERKGCSCWMMFMLQHLSEEKWTLVRSARGPCYCCGRVRWLGGSVRWRDKLEWLQSCDLSIQGCGQRQQNVSMYFTDLPVALENAWDLGSTRIGRLLGCSWLLPTIWQWGQNTIFPQSAAQICTKIQYMRKLGDCSLLRLQQTMEKCHKPHLHGNIFGWLGPS